MKNIGNQEIVLFNPENIDNDSGFSKKVEMCFEGVHFSINVWEGGDGHSLHEGYQLRVIGNCDSNCEVSYHKNSTIAKMLGEEIEWIMDKDVHCILFDIPLLVNDFMDKGLVGESSRSYERINDHEYPEKVLRPKP